MLADPIVTQRGCNSHGAEFVPFASCLEPGSVGLSLNRNKTYTIWNIRVSP